MSREQQKSKTVVLGLDGVSYSLLCRFARAGLMPNMSSLIEKSTFGSMNSTLPEISPVAWTTFFTGRSPAEHGIYGFTDFESPGYNVIFNSSAQVRTPYIWDWMSMRGGKSVVLNVPLTYPARPLSGVMVSGFVALDYDRAAFPAWVADYLREENYRLEADFEKVHQDRDVFLDDLSAALEGRFKLFERFWPDEWDLFVLVATDTDRLFHFFLGEYLDGGPIRDYFENFFTRVDDLAGQVVSRTEELAAKGENVSLIMLSDHGFTAVKEEFHLNRWLAANGFMTEPGPRAAALALDPTRIYFNRQPRFAGGRINPADCPGLARDLESALIREPAVKSIEFGRDLYSGPLAPLAPDLVVRPNPGYEFKAKFNAGPIYTPSPLTGTHTYEDAFYLINNFDSKPDSPDIRDILDLGRLLLSIYGF